MFSGYMKFNLVPINRIYPVSLSKSEFIVFGVLLPPIAIPFVIASAQTKILG